MSHVIPPVDPNWLLSSTAQSAAVLVAIVGGFLVSRIISLGAERGSVIQRRQELSGRQRIKRAEYDEIHSDRLAISCEWFNDRHRAEVIEARGDIDPDTLLEWIPRGSSAEEMRPVAEHLTSAVRTAFSEIGSKCLYPPETARELRDDGVLIPDGDDSIFELVADRIAEERGRSGLNAAVVSLNPSRWSARPYVPTPDIVYQRQDARIDLERQLSSELRALSSELSLLDDELRTFRKPEGVRGTIMALAYLALVGIVLPTVLMALRPVPDSPVSRIVVVAAFISGLAVLLAYFLIRTRALKPPDPSGGSSHPQDGGNTATKAGVSGNG